MGKWVHRLSNIDAETGTGDCAECGIGVRLKWKASKERFVCLVGHGRPEPKPRAPSQFSTRSESHRFYRYGLKPGEFEALCESQGNRCAICRKERVLVPDHSHKTGAVRGALCNNCNKGIGFLGDNLMGVMRAVRYLRKSEGPR